MAMAMMIKTLPTIWAWVVEISLSHVTIKKQDIDVTSSNLQQMIIDICCSAPSAFINKFTLSFGTTKPTAVAGPVNAHGSSGEN